MRRCDGGDDSLSDLLGDLGSQGAARGGGAAGVGCWFSGVNAD